jgi:hypothetical protein
MVSGKGAPEDAAGSRASAILSNEMLQRDKTAEFGDFGFVDDTHSAAAPVSRRCRKCKVV